MSQTTEAMRPFAEALMRVIDNPDGDGPSDCDGFHPDCIVERVRNLVGDGDKTRLYRLVLATLDELGDNDQVARAIAEVVDVDAFLVELFRRSGLQWLDKAEARMDAEEAARP